VSQVDPSALSTGWTVAAELAIDWPTLGTMPPTTAPIPITTTDATSFLTIGFMAVPSHPFLVNGSFVCTVCFSRLPPARLLCFNCFGLARGIFPELRDGEGLRHPMVGSS
jgi:hypothetical protein